MKSAILGMKLAILGVKWAILDMKWAIQRFVIVKGTVKQHRNHGRHSVYVGIA